MSQAIAKPRYGDPEPSQAAAAVDDLVRRGRAAMDLIADADQARIDEAVTALAWSIYKPEHAADLAELSDRAFVLVARRIGPYVFDRIISDCLAAGFHPRIVQEVETSISVLGMVAAGMGLGLVVAPLAQFKHPDLAFVELTGLSYRLEFSLAWRSASDNPQVEALRSAAAACFD